MGVPQLPLCSKSCIGQQLKAKIDMVFRNLNISTQVKNCGGLAQMYTYCFDASLVIEGSIVFVKVVFEFLTYCEARNFQNVFGMKVSCSLIVIQQKWKVLIIISLRT
eukprot:TRINITY_DN12264_c0_g1_i1.p3 TRINITY_DN12264_c0_g1~~TRINITY_DN12264_c0_g1_i1.p3  ORF type:complete len:107 (-),score=0.79 TRINITY_DN12264_c0_g1_i1:44-364(-)